MATLHPSKSQPQDPQALLGLVEIGAHLIFCTADKIAYQKGWQLRRNAKRPAAVREHIESGGLMGLVPGSLSLVIFDADAGDPARLIEAFPPLVAIPTSKPGRFHLVYTDMAEWRPRDYWYAGSFGQVRCEGGFVYLHDVALLLDAVLGRTRDYPPPSGPELVIGPKARKIAVATDLVKPRKKPVRRAAGRSKRPAGAKSKPKAKPKPKPRDEAQEAWAGDSFRRGLLFDLTREWAYPRLESWREDKDYTSWELLVLERAEAVNDELLEPLPIGEVLTTALSVARWTWEKYNRGGSREPVDVELQRRRGLRLWYGDGSDRTLAWCWLRNMAIQRDAAKGLKTKDLAVKYRLSTRRIRYIVKMQLGPCPE